MKKILIVEDDPTLREELKVLLNSSGYEACYLKKFDQVIEDILNQRVDLVLLDIHLPGVNGEKILKDLRKESDIPVIMVTSLDNETDEVLSMSYGADDYITKPYNPTILLLRIEAIFKRMEKDYSIFDYESIRVIPDKGIIKTEHGEVYLTKNEMLILKYFLLHRGVIVSREEIMRFLWDSEEFVDDNTLSVNVSRLRSKLEEAGLDHPIETRKGIGYFLK